MHNRSLNRLRWAHDRTRTARPGSLDALSLLAEVADELVVRTVRDTHLAVVDRVHGLLRPAARRRRAAWAERVHRAHRSGRLRRARARAARPPSRALDAASATRWAGPAARRPDPRGARSSSAVNGLIGDRLAARAAAAGDPDGGRGSTGATSPLTADGAAPRRTPDATGGSWSSCTASARTSPTGSGAATRRHDVRRGAGRPGWTPVLLRANTGLTAARERRRARPPCSSSLVARVAGAGRADRAGRPLDGRPGDARRRRRRGRVRPAAGPTGSPTSSPSAPRTSARRSPAGSAPAAGLLGRLPESAAFGRILDWRSVGVHDLVDGLAEDVPPLPHARYRLVAATLTASPRHPVGPCAGDCLVRDAVGVRPGRAACELFPGAEVLHVRRRRPLRPAQPPAGRRGAARLAGLSAASSTAAESAVGEQGWLSRGSVGASG